MIRTVNLWKTYVMGEEEIHALRGVTFEVRRGEYLAIIGPSGSGKSTLLLMLGALLKPSEGNIHLNGDVISDLPESRLPDVRLRHFGFVFQDFNLLSALNVLENVALVAELSGLRRSEARQKATALLTELGLGERLHYDPAKLSGGEKQRVAIARALANDPKVILADEPTASLDSQTGREVMQLLCDVACKEGRAVIIVSHDPRLVEIANRVITIEDGKLLKEDRGNHDPYC